MSRDYSPSRVRRGSSAQHRLERRGDRLASQSRRSSPQKGVAVQCGWGRLIFAPSFATNESIARAITQESPGQRDIVFYLSDPHVVLAYAPHQLFLDPSHIFRIWMDQYRPSRRLSKGFVVRQLSSKQDIRQSNVILAKCQMMTLDEDFVWKSRRSRVINYLVASDRRSGHVLGVVCGVDHHFALGDPENGSSLWSLAVDPDCPYPGVGEQLTRHLVEYFMARGRSFMDLSVMHNNQQAIALYKKLGFTRVNLFSVKKKNIINEPLFTAPAPEQQLNPYARIITDEARRRGIEVEILDAEAAYFRLRFGGRSIICRESLSELTSAIAMSRCDDKRVTHKIFRAAGIRVPQQVLAGESKDNAQFLASCGSVVVKPVRGEQGQGVAVDLRSPEQLEKAIERARLFCPEVILEEMVGGQDLRILVIGYEMVAASVRRPPQVIGTGRDQVISLIEKQNRRRRAATEGESFTPIDEETKRCVGEQGYQLDSVLPEGEVLILRKTANLHTGGTIHDVTEDLSPELKLVAEEAARSLGIPVVGLDLIVPDIRGKDYVIIEANERPGLANHEPQPTAEKFVDLLFPQTAQEQRALQTGVTTRSMSRQEQEVRR